MDSLVNVTIYRDASDGTISALTLPSLTSMTDNHLLPNKNNNNNQLAAPPPPFPHKRFSHSQIQISPPQRQHKHYNSSYFRKLQSTTILIQKSIRGMFCRNILQNKHNAGIELQQIWRGYTTHKYFTQSRIASIEIQRVWC